MKFRYYLTISIQNNHQNVDKNYKNVKKKIKNK